MNRAYDRVCAILKVEKAGHAARLKAGEVIMRLARTGESDERKLRDAALREAIGRDSLRHRTTT